jgi:hypothetical protein
MHLICLTPSFGTVRLPRNLLALYEAQQLYDTDTAHLIIFADDGLLETQTGGEPPLTWEIIGTDQWIPLQEKYGVMLTMPSARGDAYVVMDVDDVYLPWHLRAHSAALRQHAWAHPSRAWSTHGVRDLSREMPQVRHLNGNRYHGALAIRADLMRDLGGWPNTDRSDYDKQQLARCRAAAGPPGDPCKQHDPSYVYRWGDTGSDHISARIVTGADGVRRYPRPRIQDQPHAGPLTPHLDHSTREIIRWLT